MARRLFIHATNVHQGGGRSLLAAILSILPGGMKSILSLDSRMPLPEDAVQELQIQRVAPTIVHRLIAERWLTNHVASGDVVLCFGNLPPLFKLRGYAVVFVQNRYLVDNVELNGFAFKTKLRLAVERYWLSSRLENADEFVVQTPSMKKLLEALTQGRIPVRVLPFVANNDEYMRKVPSPEMQRGRNVKFLYVASGEPHKNHRQLIEAWCLLAKEDVFPSLILTLDRARFADLCSWIEEKVEQHRLNVQNVGDLPSDQVKQLYSQADALIFPSSLESFGMPLIEARQVELPVLASELDYVRDILDPEQTFNPASAVSIARAVKRYMCIEELPLPLQDAAGFMRSIFESASTSASSCR